jgi:hypothetical protein
MPIAEFEEKEYENPTTAQLLQGSPCLYTPGQVLEYAIGFDAAMHVQQTAFWTIFGMTPPPGERANPAWWSTFASTAPPRFPPFRLNLFVQYKRPFYVNRSRGREWVHWNRDYYRFPLTPHQQTALEQLSAGLGAQGLVVYASPTFHTHDELYSHTENQSLVRNSNFVRATGLTGHGTYTYCQSGTTGIACSDPKGVPSLDLLAEVVNLCQANTTAPEGAAFLQELELTVDRVMENHENEAKSRFYRSRAAEAMRQLGQPPEHLTDLIRTWVKANAAAVTIGMSWAIGTSGPLGR